MVKTERFVVKARVQNVDDIIDDLAIKSFGHYPDHDEMEYCWIKAEEDFYKVFYLTVEKQTYFE